MQSEVSGAEARDGRDGKERATYLIETPSRDAASRRSLKCLISARHTCEKRGRETYKDL
jgi:hypothetical protein